MRAEHQPAPGDLSVIPSRNNIRPSAKYQMKVVGQDRIAEQINTKGRGELLQIQFDPNLAMIKILARDSIVIEPESQQVRFTCFVKVRIW